MKRGRLSNKRNKEIWINTNCFITYPTGVRLRLYLLLRHFFPTQAAALLDLDQRARPWMNRNNNLRICLFTEPEDTLAVNVVLGAISANTVAFSSTLSSINTLAEQESLYAIVTVREWSNPMVHVWQGFNTRVKNVTK